MEPDMSWQDREQEEIKADEGLRLIAYKDSLGNTTIGYGHTGEDVASGQSISQDEADSLFDADFEQAVTEAQEAVPFFQSLDGPRKGAMVNLAFNMGGSNLASFHGMLNALDSGDYTAAALHLMNSRYARQVKNRAVRLAFRIRTGQYALRS